MYSHANITSALPGSLDHQLGFDKLPKTLTKNAVYSLTTLNSDQIVNSLFAVQVLKVTSRDELENDSFDECPQSHLAPEDVGFGLCERLNLAFTKKVTMYPTAEAVLEISDGIATTTAKVERHVLEELNNFDNLIKPFSVIIIRGSVIRFEEEETKQTSLMLHEAPIMVINDVQETKIGDPKALWQALQLKKYEASAGDTEQEPNLTIPYTSKLNSALMHEKMPLSIAEKSLRMRNHICRYSSRELRNSVILFGNHIRSDDLPFDLDSPGQDQEQFLKIQILILSYAFHYSKAKILLKRLSRSSFIAANFITNYIDPETGKRIFARKIVEIPVFSSSTIITRGRDFEGRSLKRTAASTGGEQDEIEKYYRVNEQLPVADQRMKKDASGLRSLYAVSNLKEMKGLRSLTMPYAFNPVNNSDNQVKELLDYLKEDRLEFLSFDVVVSNSILPEVFKAIKDLKKLQKLQLNISCKDSLLALANKNFTKECSISHLEVNFVQIMSDEKKKPFEIRFPKYLKHLRSLSLLNICDPEFTDTMFDMASQRKLKHLSLQMVDESQSLPNFSEALTKFKSLESLHLSLINYAKIHQDTFLNFISSEVSTLKSLSLNQISLSDAHFTALLDHLRKSTSLRELRLTQIPIDSDIKRSAMLLFLKLNNSLSKLLLSQNNISNLSSITDALSSNTTLKELTISQQSYFKDENSRSPFAFGDEPTEIANSCLEKLTLSLGLMQTTLPLMQCCLGFQNLRQLVINNVPLKKLHFETIDNYMVKNDGLTKLKLINVRMASDCFGLIFETLCNSKRIRSLDVSNNPLKDLGCAMVAEMLIKNKSIQSLKVSQASMTEAGLVCLLNSLRQNNQVTKLVARDNRIKASRRLLALVGDLVIYFNSTLRYLILTCNQQYTRKDFYDDPKNPFKFISQTVVNGSKSKKNESKKESQPQMDRVGPYKSFPPDEDMVAEYERYLQEKSLLQVFTI